MSSAGSGDHFAPALPGAVVPGTKTARFLQLVAKSPCRSATERKRNAIRQHRTLPIGVWRNEAPASRRRSLRNLGALFLQVRSRNFSVGRAIVLHALFDNLVVDPFGNRRHVVDIQHFYVQ